MITYDAHGPHGSGSGPVWIVTDPAADYPDGRFDDALPTFRPVVNVEPNITAWADNSQRHFQLLRRDDGSTCLYYVRPNDPAQYVVWDSLDEPKRQEAEQIADATRRALPDIETVFRKWGYIQAHPLPELRALLDMLTPPAPKWTQECGHPVSSIASTDEGTHYCIECANE